MTHFDEMSCLLYLDGQLDSLKTKELELHVRSCGPCRSLLAALQRESALLHQAMVEEEESVPARLLAPPGREAMPWFWIGSFGLAVLGALTVWTQVIEPWQNNLSQAGFGGGNMLAMLFFSGVFWKGWSEMAILATGLAALTLAAPFVFLLWRKRRHLKPVALVMCGLALLLVFPSGANAAEIIKGESYTLAEGETLKNDLVVLSGTIEIVGTLDGDLIAFGESVDVKGRVTGDVLVFAKRLTVSGTVDGSLRSFANSATISGQVTRGVTAFLETLEVTKEARLGRGAMLFGDSLRMSGRIERDLMLFGKRVSLDGFVGGNFYMRGDTLRIGSGSEILGTAKYQGRKEPEVAASAKLASPLEKIASDRKPAYLTFGFYWDRALGYASILGLGIVIFLISPRAFRDVTRSARRPGSALGILVLLVVPVAACVACLTLVGFALGMVSMVLWTILIYVAQIYVGSALGEMMLGKSNTKAGTIGRLAAGLAVIRILNAVRVLLLPGLGFWLLFWIIIASWGLGAITVALYEQLRWKPTPPAAMAAPGIPVSQ